MVHHAPQYLLALCMYNTDGSYAPEHTRSYCRFQRCCRCCRRHHHRRHHHCCCHRLRRRRRPSRRHSHPGSPRTAMGLKSTGCPRGACEVRYAEVQTAVQTKVQDAEVSAKPLTHLDAATRGSETSTLSRTAGRNLSSFPRADGNCAWCGLVGETPQGAGCCAPSKCRRRF